FRSGRLADALVRILDLMLDDPAAIVVDDAQWTDPTSNAVLRGIARVAPGRRWQLIVIRRPAETGFDPAGARRIAVGRLAPHELRDIVVRSLEAVPLRPHE